MIALNFMCLVLSAYMCTTSRGGLRVMWFAMGVMWMISLIANAMAILVQFT